jgi:hypothetical protein
LRELVLAALAIALPTIGSADDFADHPATEVMSRSDPIVLPDFGGRDAAYRNFRTRIRDGLKDGPNFGGHYSLIGIGCGTSCLFAYLADAQTGEVFPFPYGGEENYEMSLDYRIDSLLVKVSWADLDQDACIHHEVVWTDTAFEFVSESRTQRVGICNK